MSANKKQAYMMIYAYNEKGECSDIKIVKIVDGMIIMEPGIGRRPEPENVSKEKPDYGR